MPSIWSFYSLDLVIYAVRLVNYALDSVIYAFDLVNHASPQNPSHFIGSSTSSNPLDGFSRLWFK